jgi:hypothetical protein
MADDWRVTATFSDAARARQAVRSLRDHKVQDDIRRRLGHRVAVSTDGPSVFLYAATEDTAREADRVLREVLTRHQLRAELALDRWHPGEEEWEDASVPMPDSDEARAAEHQRLMDDEAEQAAAARAAGWQVRVELPSHRQAVDLAAQFLAEGRPVVRRWKYLILGASSEDEAGALAQAIRQEAPANSSVRTEPNPWAHFVIRQAGTAAVPYYHFD